MHSIFLTQFSILFVENLNFKFAETWPWVLPFLCLAVCIIATSWARLAWVAKALYKPAFFCSSLVKRYQHGCTVRSSNLKQKKSTSTSSVHTLIEAPNEAFRWKIFTPFLVSGQLASLVWFPLTLGSLWTCSKHLGGERKWPQPLRVWHFKLTFLSWYMHKLFPSISFLHLLNTSVNCPFWLTFTLRYLIVVHSAVIWRSISV